MPYLEPLDADAAPEVAEVFALYERTRGFTPNSVRTMARLPRIASAFAELNQAILYEGTVPGALKMLVALVASTAAVPPLLPVAHGDARHFLRRGRREDRPRLGVRDLRAFR